MGELVSIFPLIYFNLIKKSANSSSEVFYKIGVLKNFLQNFMESICTGVYFRRPETLLKQDSGTNVFLCFCEIFKSICFVEHLRRAASEKGNINCNNTVRGLSKIWGFLYRKAVF